MAVTKRLRFEIFRRDNYACRYCGAMAPETVLTVDHVIPIALGGSDDATNLVTACKDCNAGKSSASADARHVADVADDAVRWAIAMRKAFDLKIEQIDLRNEYLGEFHEVWAGFHYKGSGEQVPLPSDWERSVEKWYGLGLPISILTDAIHTAMAKRDLKGYDTPEFRYMAGVVWSTITELENQVAATMAVPPNPEPSQAATEGTQAWDDGWDACLEYFALPIEQHIALRAVCDGEAMLQFRELAGADGT